MLKTTGNPFRKNSWAALAFSTLVAALLTLPASASIIGGDLNSIIGGDAKSIANQEFIAIGPVESIDRRKNVVVVLGQSFSIDSMTRITVSERLSASQGPKVLKLIQRGDYVAIGGWQSSARTVAASKITVLASSYVDGSSSTYVKGRIGAIDFALGRLTVGSLQVDYTASLGSLGANQLAVGRTVELAGMRPTPGGAMLAFSAKAEEPQSIIGGDVNSIIGGDANSIIGGDLNSIIGGDTNSIIGGDLNSIIGGDTNSIIGGDLNSIIGGDTNSIIGGDLNSIIGGDTNSIIGGDLNSIIGGDTNSIIGGDLNSIIGGDANSIIGGDLNSIIGGDTNSIIGGDTNSIIGGDTNSIIGGDTNSIIGGDTNSIIGGDLNSIIGGDAR